MEVNLEPLSTEYHDAPAVAQDADTPAPLPRAPSVLPPNSETLDPALTDDPVKRPRGRPKGKAAPKAPAPKKAPARAKRPPSSSEDSSSDSEPRRPRGTSAAVRNLMQDDMETKVLQFLTARKQSQQAKRNELWQRLASSGLSR